MFWTDSKSGINKSTLNGTQLVTLVTSSRSTKGIDLDRRNKLVFWVDAATNSVESVDYNGKKRKLLYRHRNFARSELVFFSSYLFVTDSRSHGVFKMNALNGTSTTFVSFSGFGTPMGLVPYDSSRQLPGNC